MHFESFLFTDCAGRLDNFGDELNIRPTVGASRLQVAQYMLRSPKTARAVFIQAALSVGSRQRLL